jgi:hypothetical protein
MWEVEGNVTAAGLVSRFWLDVGITHEEFHREGNIVHSSSEYISE